MTVLHFTVMPCAPYTGNKLQGEPYSCNICPCDNGIVSKISLAVSFFHFKFSYATIIRKIFNRGALWSSFLQQLKVWE